MPYLDFPATLDHYGYQRINKFCRVTHTYLELRQASKIKLSGVTELIIFNLGSFRMFYVWKLFKS